MADDRSRTQPIPVAAVTPTAGRPRLASLDAMRGLVIALMLLVNMTWDRDALPAQFFHVPWNDPAQGATITDLVFPWFVFIMGAAAPLSVAGGRGRGKTNGEILRVATARGAKLYLWGVVLTVASFAHQRPLAWTDLLSWNILQLIGAAYVVTVAVWMLPGRGRIAFVVSGLLVKWATLMLPWEVVTRYVTPRPREGAPIGPGTWAHFDAIKQLLHMEFVPVSTWWSQLVGWLGMSAQYVPLATIAVIGGLLTEALIRGSRDDSPRAKQGVAGRVVAISVGLVGAGFLLQWGYAPEGGGLWGAATAPFSKWFFSPAYCLLAAGTGGLLLAACYVVVDVAGVWRFPLLRSVGKNALAVYVGAELSFKLLFSKWQMPLPAGGADSIAAATQAWIGHATGSPAAASLGWALLWVAGWTLVARRLDRAGVYWRA